MIDRSTTQIGRNSILAAVSGRRRIARTVSSGVFLCPTESTERAFWQFRVRTWFTIFNVPVIPGEIIEEYIECFCCGLTLDPRVLSSNHPALRTVRAG